MSSTNANEAIRQLVRQARQHVEALKRSGVEGLPKPRASSQLQTLKMNSELDAPPLEMEIANVEPLPAERESVRVVEKLQPPPIAGSLFAEPHIDIPSIPPDERAEKLLLLAKEVSTCVRCPQLASTRTQTVFGSGSPTARLMFIGEAPGADEDRTGLPFVGRAGMLLTDMITKGMGLTREEVYIANILKSRPPENRNPLPDEVRNCLPYLERQIEIVRPEFICMLGKTAAASLLDTALPIGKLRGKWQRYRGIATIVTYHPSYLLRTPTAKKDAWKDLQMLMQAMGLNIPSKKNG